MHSQSINCTFRWFAAVPNSNCYGVGFDVCSAHCRFIVCAKDLRINICIIVLSYLFSAQNFSAKLSH